VPDTDDRLALRVRDLRKAFKSLTAVDGINLDVLSGECFGLLGPNGAGKTTTIEICEGLTPPDSGDLQVLGRRWRDDRVSLRDRIGVQLQETQLSEKLTVRETVRLFRSFYSGGVSAQELIGLVELEEKQDARVGNLSGGQKQRLAIACALAGDPDLLFLDEPTTGLDPHARRQVWDVIEQFKRGGRTIILTTHYMEEAEKLCDRVAIMDQGRIIALGPPRELIASMGAGHVIEFSAEGTDALDLSVLRQIGGVQEVAQQNGGVRVLVTELHESVPSILREVARQGAVLSALRTHSATLEDVFVLLTGRRLRDE
jgi:ABC-2 type transport system ATP-binding protein